MSQFNEGIKISDNLARKLIGTSWCLDETAGTLNEVLGRTKPATHFGPWFKTAREAGEGYRRLPLPSAIRLPRGTPIAIGRPVTSTQVETQIYLLDYTDLLGHGLRLEKRPIRFVEYVTAPGPLKRAFDFVAASIYFQSSNLCRVRVGVDAFGFHYAEGGPFAKDPVWLPVAQVSAHIGRNVAEDAADQFASSLIRAVNWREHRTA